MSEIKLFIATTIDGFIARENGSLDWLNEIPNPENLDYGYGDFLAGIDVLIMGRKTYEEILGFGIEWPYDNCTSFVVTSETNYQTKTANTVIINRIDQQHYDRIKLSSKKNIWIVGGGQLITEFINNNLIDEMTLSLIPTILGKGIRLFPNRPKETKFDLVNTESFDTGVVNLTYKRIKNQEQ
ncbi:MAG: dihydrofolate reductase [Candidatus Cloacimonadota bacterium]|nr:MAG: dihydrofolate reductase [Candidatus Cloacimonadota bacterium]